MQGDKNTLEGYIIAAIKMEIYESEIIIIVIILYSTARASSDDVAVGQT